MLVKKGCMISFYAVEHLRFNSNNDLFQPAADFICGLMEQTSLGLHCCFTC